MKKEFEIELARELGGINQHLKSIDGTLKKQNGRLGKHDKRLDKHDVFLGKIGIAFVGIVFIITTLITTIFNWIKDKLF